MAQIFISHSSKDKDSVDLVSRAFASTQVRAIFEEFDAIHKGAANADRIANDIRQANAVFMLLGTNVEILRHTRDWIGWEGGFAAGMAFQTNKDIWVLESITEADTLSVLIPYLRHYLCFNPLDPAWQGYLSQVITSYDDSHFLKAMSAGAVTGAAVAPKSQTAAGAAWGAGAGLLLAALNAQTRPSGAFFQCPKCWSSYSVHLCAPWMRCPVCNSRWQFP
jgi:hypothetical protein